MGRPLFRVSRACAAALGLVAALAGSTLARAAGAPCSATVVCVSADGTRSLGPASLVAQGFIHGVDPTTNPGLVAALRPRAWLYDDNEAAYASAASNGASITYLLSDAWEKATAGPQGPQVPWQNWATYSRFIANQVRQVLAAGQTVSYWSIQSEPDGLIGAQRGTPAQMLREYAIGVAAVRSVDPHARFVGPNLAAYNDNPASPTIDLVRFLDFAVANRLPVDAVAWHEVGNRVSAAYRGGPADLIDHVNAARRLLAARPSLGRPVIVINEYQSNATHLIPGWSVAWIAALEAAGVTQANRACWHEPDITGRPIAECSEGSVDGLFIPESGLPQAVYFVHRAYADMAGNKAPTSTTNAAVTAFSTYDPGSSTLRVLLGRHQSCTPDVRVDCPDPASTVPPPVDVALRLTVPNAPSLVSVDVERVPNSTGAMAGPVPVSSSTVAVGGGPLTLRLPGVVDGDAYVVTVRPL